MSATAQHRAVIEALGLSADDLRSLADALDAGRQTVLVRDVAEACLAGLPRDHRYVKSLRRLVDWAGDRDASTVRAADIATWARRAGDEARSTTWARHGVGAEEALVLAVRAAWARALREEMVTNNPANDVAVPERPPSRRTALACEQLTEAHLSLLAHSRDPDLDGVVFQLLRETACRRAGAIGLAYADLAPTTRTVRVVEKYAKQRWLPTSAHLMQRLRVHACERDHPGCSRVLHRRDGGHVNDKWFEGFAQRIQQVPWAGELGVTAHWLRHTTLTDIERIAGVRVAAAYAGHADATFGVTGIYTKPSQEEMRAAHARLFFDSPSHADNPAVAPHLLRRARAAPSQIEFASA
jgi:site-specific recombinase XerD